MASMLQFSSLFLPLLLSCFFVLPTTADDTPTAAHHALEIPVEKIKKALSDSNYLTMSMTLELALSNLIPTHEFFNNKDIKTLTIFCPSDKAFTSPNFKYTGPPLTLLRYHVALENLDREVLETSQLHWSKVDTLLPGHPLVVTSVNRHASVNDVKISYWNLYNDGHVIVHGVEDFFDPAFQTIWFPQYDGGVLMQNDGSYAEALSRVFDYFHEPKNRSELLMVFVYATAAILCLLLRHLILCLCWARRREAMDGYVTLKSGPFA
uniref:FAS1 domain-containing protein n=1 Tax=Nelumbo nucifera TaxID=4432 RepID=A0A822ZUB0_NELNU|nr:TPA_asm: hypothetical protein HUJ06_003708 [Nelumbo nucifera]